jgi:trehalose 6-phosphate synthase
VRRHQKLLERIRAQDVHWWRRTYLETLQSVEP